MNSRKRIKIKLLVFYWLSSFILAVAGYYILSFIMPDHYVFGALFRMYLYHLEYPIQYIFIPCFFYGIIAVLFADIFFKRKLPGQIVITLIIIILTVIISSAFGGMLWHIHDMMAGHFPMNWFAVIVRRGFFMGFEAGWLIIILSIPYSIIGSIACFFLTRQGIEFSKNKVPVGLQ